MTHEAWILFSGLAITNITALLCGIIHITTRLTRIETDVAWLKRNQAKCQPTSENPTP